LVFFSYLAELFQHPAVGSRTETYFAREQAGTTGAVGDGRRL